jgi:hypothetical protein
MTTKLTPYQVKIIKDLESGKILYRSHLGPFTGAYHFQGVKKGINVASIDKLIIGGYLKKTDKMTMHGLLSYVHIVGTSPWQNDPSWIAYMRRH